MALKKTKGDNRTGVICVYHRIESATIEDSKLICKLASYVSKSFREHGVKVRSSEYVFEVTLEEEESMGIRQLAYKKIKELSAWKDAEDC